MINLVITEEGIPLVWDPKEWLNLRDKHRIVGSLIGPSVPFLYQDKFAGLPMALHPYEATLLVEKKIAQLVRYPSLTRAPGKGVKEEYEKFKTQISNEQITCLIEERKRQVGEMIDRIIEGKQRKLMGMPSKKKHHEADTSAVNTMPEVICRNRILEEELAKIRTPALTCTSAQTFTTYPWLRTEDACRIKWKYPSTPMESLHYDVFKDFWERGLFVTSGDKFGVDFLVYPGDPCQYHAHQLVVCIDRDSVIRPRDLAALCRLGTAVNKTVVYASRSKDKTLMYQSLKWYGFNKD